MNTGEQQAAGRGQGDEAMGIDRKAFVRPERRYGIYPIIHGAVAGDLSRAERLERLGFAGIVGNVPYGRTFPEYNDKE